MGSFCCRIAEDRCSISKVVFELKGRNSGLFLCLLINYYSCFFSGYLCPSLANYLVITEANKAISIPLELNQLQLKIVRKLADRETKLR